MAKKIPFPKEVFVQNAAETGDADSAENNWLSAQKDKADVTAGVRVAVYKFDRVIVIERHETFTEKSAT